MGMSIEKLSELARRLEEGLKRTSASILAEKRRIEESFKSKVKR